MAAAPLPLADHEYSPVSPELALVDAELAAELRERLADPAESVPPPVVEPAGVEPAPAPVPSDDVEDFGSIEDLIVMPDEIDVHPSSEEPESADPVLDLIVGYDAAEVAPADEEPEEVGSVMDLIAEYAAPEMSP